MQEWVKTSGARLVVIFEGRDTAGKGGAIQRVVLGQPRRAGAAIPRALENPLKRWKLSPMDLESISRWDEYSKARDAMLAATDTDAAPWTVVESEDKRRARLNTIAHLLDTVPWTPTDLSPLSIPARPAGEGYVRPPRELARAVPDHAAMLLDGF